MEVVVVWWRYGGDGDSGASGGDDGDRGGDG